MTSWNPNIPNPADVPASDATAMQQNFSVLDTAWKIDHIQLSQASTQGFHKQISFSGAGAFPYGVAGTQSYEYERLLASSTRSYLEYQPSGPDTFAANPAIVPLSFKAYAVVDVTGLVGTASIPVGNYKRRFNINDIVFNANLTTFIVTFNENMPDAFYSSLISTALVTGVNPNPGVVSITAQAVNTLSFTGKSNGTLYTIAVM